MKMSENLHPAEKPTVVSMTQVEKVDDNVMVGFRLAETGRVIMLVMNELEAFWLAQALEEVT